MLDLIKKWWFRKWSKYEFFREENVLDDKQRRKYSYMIYKATSNDGLIKIKKIKV